MEDIIKKRKIRLSQPVSGELKTNAINRLTETNGVLSAEFKDDSTLVVSYDLSCLNLETVEGLIRDSGLIISNNVFRSFIRGWVVFAEENELTNLRTTPRSCCEVPKR